MRSSYFWTEIFCAPLIGGKAEFNWKHFLVLIFVVCDSESDANIGACLSRLSQCILFLDEPWKVKNCPILCTELITTGQVDIRRYVVSFPYLSLSLRTFPRPQHSCIFQQSPKVFREYLEYKSWCLNLIKSLSSSHIKYGVGEILLNCWFSNVGVYWNHKEFHQYWCLIPLWSNCWGVQLDIVIF